ncbi:S41 family peptidase [Niabella drilacis]|uniref:Peptidase family S41 n=1 Tax=Niabella drilacis (strain DSM 25811 / CCM 8410 / CCUG 62505 / LMG 26954 / E90) TaxID=1285928 RepID=A0A1G7B120_NIADE|nr:S41 family peptidase [Niabella drilacis]SDE20630.1 Peptidase family S41 [Niabella drilacis]
MKWWIGLFIGIILYSCKAGREAFNPDKKFGPQQLQSDYRLFRKILEERHPSLYWYTAKPAMDSAFEAGALQLKDSLTEQGFRRVLTKVIATVRCGHTSVRASRNYTKYMDTLKTKPLFPLYIKTWNDTVVVAYNIFKNDSSLVRGALIDSIGCKPVKAVLDSLRGYIPADGGNRIAQDQRLSTGTYLGALYTWVNGWPGDLDIRFRDSTGRPGKRLIRPYKPPVDTSRKQTALSKRKQKEPRRKRLQEERSLQIDSSGRFAVMELNSFSEKLELRSFFRHSFRKLRRQKIENLVVGLRSNGGGRVSNSNLFMKYLSNRPFKLADSLFAVTRSSAYSRFIRNDWALKWFMRFTTHKKADGRFHFTWYEKHYFRPKKKNHYEGTVYLLSGGNSFSATSLVVGGLRSQEHIIVLGEPTGGGAYGNSALLIPDVTLPATQIRFRLPLFRLVTDKSIPKDGRGVQPEIRVLPTVEAIRQGRDYKMEKVKDLIRINSRPGLWK